MLKEPLDCSVCGTSASHRLFDTIFFVHLSLLHIRAALGTPLLTYWPFFWSPTGISIKFQLKLLLCHDLMLVLCPYTDMLWFCDPLYLKFLMPSPWTVSSLWRPFRLVGSRSELSDTLHRNNEWQYTTFIDWAMTYVKTFLT